MEWYIDTGAPGGYFSFCVITEIKIFYLTEIKIFHLTFYQKVRPAPLGRPLKDRSGKVQLIVNEDEDMVVRSDKPLQFKPKKQHNLAKSVRNNETAPKRHTQQ